MIKNSVPIWFSKGSELRIRQVGIWEKVTFSIDDSTWNWCDTDNYTVWWNVVSWIKDKDDAIWYANYLLAPEDWYDDTGMTYKEWKRCFWNTNSPIVNFANNIILEQQNFDSNVDFDSFEKSSKVYVTIVNSLYGEYEYSFKNTEVESNVSFDKITVDLFEKIISKLSWDYLQIEELFENYTIKDVSTKIYVEWDNTYIISEKKIITSRLEKLIENEF